MENTATLTGQRGLPTNRSSGILANLLGRFRKQDNSRPLELDKILGLQSYNQIEAMYRALKGNNDVQALDRYVKHPTEFVLRQVIAEIDDLSDSDDSTKALLNRLGDQDLTNLPHFSVPLETITGKKTGKNILARGDNVVSYLVLPTDEVGEDGKDYKIVKTFVSVFVKKAERERTGDFANYYHNVGELLDSVLGLRPNPELEEAHPDVTESLVSRYNPTMVKLFAKEQKILSPRYNDGKILADVFLDSGRDMLSASAGMTLEEKLRMVKKVIEVDTLMADAATVAAPMYDSDHELERDMVSNLLDRILKRTVGSRGRMKRLGDKLLSYGRKNNDALENRVSRIRDFYGTSGEGIDNMIIHADNLATNTILNEDGTLTKRDFEFAGYGPLAWQTVQMLTKLNVYDHNGEPKVINGSKMLKDGYSFDEHVLLHQTGVLEEIGTDYDEAQFRKGFDRMKVLDLFAWATRYKFVGELEQTMNGYDADDVADYYYTLTMGELGRQAEKAEAAGDNTMAAEIRTHAQDLEHVLGSHNYSILDEDTMKGIDSKLNPMTTVWSYLNIDSSREKGRIIKRALKSLRKNRLRRYGVWGAAALLTVAAAACTVAVTRGQVGDLSGSKRSYYPAQDEKERMGKYVDFAVPDIQSSEIFKRYCEEYKEKGAISSRNFAAARFIDADSLEKAVAEAEKNKPGSGTEWHEVNFHLPEDMQVFLNNFVMRDDHEMAFKFRYKDLSEFPKQVNERLCDSNEKYDRENGHLIRDVDFLTVLHAPLVWRDVHDLLQNPEQVVLTKIDKRVQKNLEENFNYYGVVTYDKDMLPDLWQEIFGGTVLHEQGILDWKRITEDMRNMDVVEWSQHIKENFDDYKIQPNYDRFKQRTRYGDLEKIAEDYDKGHWKKMCETSLGHVFYTSRSGDVSVNNDFKESLEMTGNVRLATLRELDREFFDGFYAKFKDAKGIARPSYVAIADFYPKSALMIVESTTADLDDVQKRYDEGSNDIFDFKSSQTNTGMLGDTSLLRPGTSYLPRSSSLEAKFRKEHPNLTASADTEGTNEAPELNIPTLEQMARNYDAKNWSDVLKTDFSALLWSNEQSFIANMGVTRDARLAALRQMDTEFYDSFVEQFKEDNPLGEINFETLSKSYPKSAITVIEGAKFKWEDVQQRYVYKNYDFLGIKFQQEHNVYWLTVNEISPTRETFTEPYSKLREKFLIDNPEFAPPVEQENFAKKGWEATRHKQENERKTAMRYVRLATLPTRIGGFGR